MWYNNLTVSTSYYTATISSDVYSDYIIFPDLPTFYAFCHLTPEMACTSLSLKIHQQSSAFLSNKRETSVWNWNVLNSLISNWHHLEAPPPLWSHSLSLSGTVNGECFDFINVGKNYQFMCNLWHEYFSFTITIWNTLRNKASKLNFSSLLGWWHQDEVLYL